ncbi:Serine/threonine-protein kinase ULK3 [Fasciolopsis buskii]|uniref:non-specific serine/threonine protein kinase n=1 Tax=Fasciolopsis buskii TaxID=27845 RepID=A0A8E0VF54_9TREM|nr:Serine/threonine-protein kinase ULK3 [Fasciolopsis buski]
MLSLKNCVIARKLGQGAYGEVYLAKLKVRSRYFRSEIYVYFQGSEKMVAVKCIPKSKLNKRAQDNLVSEISILQKLRHPHIVRLIDFSWDSERVYLFMEYCAGGDLSQFIRTKRRLPEQLVRRFLRQLECLFGSAPYAFCDSRTLREKLIAGEAIKLPTCIPISADCAALVKGLLKRNPAERMNHEDFFAHPFVDLKHAPSAKSLDKAVNFFFYFEADFRRSRTLESLESAWDFEKRGDLKQAHEYYTRGLTYLLSAVECNNFVIVVHNKMCFFPSLLVTVVGCPPSRARLQRQMTAPARPDVPPKSVPAKSLTNSAPPGNHSTFVGRMCDTFRWFLLGNKPKKESKCGPTSDEHPPIHPEGGVPDTRHLLSTDVLSLIVIFFHRTPSGFPPTKLDHPTPSPEDLDNTAKLGIETAVPSSSPSQLVDLSKRVAGQVGGCLDAPSTESDERHQTHTVVSETITSSSDSGSAFSSDESGRDSLRNSVCRGRGPEKLARLRTLSTYINPQIPDNAASYADQTSPILPEISALQMALLSDLERLCELSKL